MYDMELLINKLKGETNADLSHLSSIIFKQIVSNSSSFPLSVVSPEELKSSTFVCSHDGKTELRASASGSDFSEETDLTDSNNGYIYARTKGVTNFPALVEIEFYPKYNYSTLVTNGLEELDKYMTNLEYLKVNTYNEDNLLESSPTGQIEVLNEIPSLKEVTINTPVYNPETLSGDVGKLGNLVNLKLLKTSGCLIYGDLADTLDAMYENGRVSGELSFKSWSPKVILTYNGAQVRVGPSTTTHQADNVYGWRIGFNADGWDVLETYNTTN